MAYKEVRDQGASDVTIRLGGLDSNGKPNPTQIEGYYLGKRDTVTKNGPATIHTFQTAKGNVDVWGKTDLNKKLAQVAEGTMTKAEFSSMKATPKGRMFIFTVGVDEDNTIEAGTSSNSSAYTDQVGDDTEDNEDVEETRTRTVATSNRKAELEALLKSKSKKA